MRYIFLFLLFLTADSLNGQTRYFVPGEVYKGQYVYLHSGVDTAKCDYGGSSKTTEESTLYIIGDSSCKSKLKKWYLVYFEDSVYFHEKYYFKDVKAIDAQLVQIVNNTPDLSERIKGAAGEIKQMKIVDSINIERERNLAEIEAKDQEIRDKKTLDSLRKQLDVILATYRAKNWVLWQWSWSYANEYSSFVDVDIELINPFKQKIKYLWITFTATNPVGDPVRDGISRAVEKTVKGVGPIEYGDHGSYQFESVFYSKVIESMKIKQIKLQFFDGTFKVITNPHEVHKEDEEN